MQFSSIEPFTLQYPDEEILTDMPYTIYGEGMYRAIETVSILDVPIIITENGVADAEDNRRELYIKRYLYAVSKAIEDGFDIRGYFYWSLMDNFEWAFGYDMKFGLFSVDYSTQKRTLRKGARSFIDIVNHKK
jgi:beta-glucosidase